jgi:hypothetical protein
LVVTHEKAIKMASNFLDDLFWAVTVSPYGSCIAHNPIQLGCPFFQKRVPDDRTEDAKDVENSVFLTHGGINMQRNTVCELRNVCGYV